MKYRNLGKAKETVNAAFDLGVNFFDCADAYSGGEAERFLGRCLREHARNEYIVSTKVFFPMGPGANDWGLSRKHIIEQLDKSLKNLGLDYVDLYFCHRFDPTTPVEETMQVLSDMVAAGKVLYYGVSEWSPVQINEALHASKRTVFARSPSSSRSTTWQTGTSKTRSWASARRTAWASPPSLPLRRGF